MTVHIVDIPILPLGKPRMTRGDRWKKRDCVQRYWAFKDELRAEVVKQIGKIPDPNTILDLSWTATFAMPSSWSKRKREEHLGGLHRSKPDRDNIDKAILDSLFEDDSKIAVGTLRKSWGTENSLVLAFEVK